MAVKKQNKKYERILKKIKDLAQITSDDLIVHHPKLYWFFVVFNCINFAISHSIFLIESYPSKPSRLDSNIVFLYFFGFNVLSIFSTIIALFNIIDHSAVVLKRGAYLNSFLFVFTNLYLINPLFNRFRYHPASAFQYYPNSLNLQKYTIPIFYINSFFVTWYMWKSSELKREEDEKIDKILKPEEKIDYKRNGMNRREFRRAERMKRN